MRSAPLLSAPAIRAIAVSWCAAQERPQTLCSFDGFSANPMLAEIATAKSTVGYFGCSSGQNCLSTRLAPGDTVVVYQAEGGWTRGYLCQSKGAGPGWRLSGNNQSNRRQPLSDGRNSDALSEPRTLDSDYFVTRGQAAAGVQTTAAGHASKMPSSPASISACSGHNHCSMATARFSKNADVTMLVSESNWAPSTVNTSADAVSVRKTLSR